MLTRTSLALFLGLIAQVAGAQTLSGPFVTNPLPLGSPGLTNEGEIILNGGTSNASEMSIFMDSLDPTIPVLVLHGIGGGGGTAYDLVPLGTPGSNLLSGAGVAWHDICNSDAFLPTSQGGTASSGYQCLRTGAGNGYHVIGSIGGASEGGTLTALPLFVNPYGAVKTYLNGVAGTDTAQSSLDIKAAAANGSHLRFVSTTTVASLPTCNATIQGSFNFVTDATAPTYNATLTGGGAIKVPVFCDGTSWKSH